jgi:SOS-response transcriptional repressor LexA
MNRAVFQSQFVIDSIKTRFGRFHMTETSASDLKKIIGLNLKRIRIQKNMSQSQLAATCGWGQSRVGNYERGSNGIDITSAQVLAKALNIEVVDILMPTTELSQNAQELFRQAKPEAFTDEKEALKFIEIVKKSHQTNISANQPDDTFTITMSGSSMEGTHPQKSIPNGSKVIVSKNIEGKNLNGMAVLVQLGEGQDPMIKELQIDGPNTYLIPWNQRYEAIKIDTDYKILGYVKKVIIDIHD